MPDLKTKNGDDFIKALEKKFGKIRITSRTRPKKKKFSHHETGDALDIGKEHTDVYHYLMNTKEGLELAKKHGYGIIDETDPEMMKKTGATGSHYHIGPDSTYKQQTLDRLESFGTDAFKEKQPYIVSSGQMPFKPLPEDLETTTNKKALFDQLDPEKEYHEYKAAMDMIFYDKEMTDVGKKSAIAEIQKEAYKKGFITSEKGPNGEIIPGGIFNEFIEKDRKVQREVLEKDILEAQTLLDGLDDILGSDNLEYQPGVQKGKQGGLFDPRAKILSKLISDNGNKPKLFDKNKLRLRDDIPEEYHELILDLMKNKGLVPKGTVLNEAKQWVDEKTGKKVHTHQIKLNDDLFSQNDFLREIQKKANKYLPEDQKITLINEDDTKGKDLDINARGFNYLKAATGGDNFTAADVDLSKNVQLNYDENSLTPFIIPDPNWDNEIENESTEENESSEENSSKDDSQKESKTPVEKQKSVEKETNFDTYNQYYTDQEYQDDSNVYNPDDYKHNFPFADALTAMSTIVTGNALAKKKLNKRDEQVSGALLNYTAELKKLSEIGLRPEEEAYAKQNLAESYQSSIDQVVKASSGNRNVVLGNLGRIDYQKQRGLTEIALADAQAKNEALYKYGEAVKYINEFDSRRDIANNEREFNDTMRTKQVGADLAMNGWANLMNTIQYDRENKPGSANHMLKSYYMRKNFNVDPGLKDDGSGTVKGTLSYEKKRQKELLEQNAKDQKTNFRANSLSEENKKISNEFLHATGGNKEMNYNFTNFLYENDISGKKLNMNNLQKATKQNDYSLLFDEMQDQNSEVEKTPTSSIGLINQEVFDMAFNENQE